MVGDWCSVIGCWCWSWGWNPTTLNGHGYLKVTYGSSQLRPSRASRHGPCLYLYGAPPLVNTCVSDWSTEPHLFFFVERSLEKLNYLTYLQYGDMCRKTTVPHGHAYGHGMDTAWLTLLSFQSSYYCQCPIMSTSEGGGFTLPFGRIQGIRLTSMAHEVRSMHVDMACCEAREISIIWRGPTPYNEVFVWLWLYDTYHTEVFDSERARCLKMQYDLLRRTGKADSHLDLMSYTDLECEARPAVEGARVGLVWLGWVGSVDTVGYCRVLYCTRRECAAKGDGERPRNSLMSGQTWTIR